jgi:hypothetical protein
MHQHQAPSVHLYGDSLQYVCLIPLCSFPLLWCAQSIKELNGSVSSFFKFFNLKLSVIVAVVPLKYLYWVSQANNKISKTDVNDSSGEEDLAVYHLEVTRNDLRTRIAKQAKGNAILQASLERRKQALHNQRLALEQEITRLQDQLESERDLRAALEIGLSMSAAQLSGAQTLDSKVCNYLKLPAKSQCGWQIFIKLDSWCTCAK